MWRFVLLLLLLPSGAWAQPKTAIQAVLMERDLAFGARDATAYLAACATDYVHTDTEQNQVPTDKLKTALQKLLTSAKTAEQKTQIDSFKFEPGVALVETYERVKLLSLSHEWLEITTEGYRRCRYRFVSVGGKWQLSRTRVLEETLKDTPRLLDNPGLGELEKRVPAPEARSIVRLLFPTLTELGQAEERKDFALYASYLAPDFAFIRLGKDPETRQSHTEKMARAYEYMSGVQVRYYLKGAELQENGELLLDVEESTRYNLKLPDEPLEKNLIIINTTLTWTKLGERWLLKRWESFTADGYENEERVDFIQKEKNIKKHSKSQ
jgi:ketosteroid isomerase-like protein